LRADAATETEIALPGGTAAVIIADRSGVSPSGDFLIGGGAAAPSPLACRKKLMISITASVAGPQKKKNWIRRFCEEGGDDARVEQATLVMQARSLTPSPLFAVERVGEGLFAR